MAVIIGDKIDFKSENVTRDKGGHSILIKVSRQLENVISTNIYASNDRPSKYDPNTDRIEGRNCSMFIVGDFSTPLSTMDRTNRWKIRRERTQDNRPKRSNGYIQNILPKTTVYTFFPAHMGHIPGQIVCQATS